MQTQKPEYVWSDGKYIQENQGTTLQTDHALHYGSAVFEGIRFYNTLNGPKIFRAHDHYKRLCYSATVIGIKSTYTIQQRIAINYQLIIKNKLERGYIRPLIRYGAGSLSLNPMHSDNTIHYHMSLWDRGSLFDGRALNICVSSIRRIHYLSADMGAKVSGYYANSIQASHEAKNKGFDGCVLLDTEGYISEGAGQNIFFTKGTTVYTPSLGTIMPGITRDTIITVLSRKFGKKIIEKKIHPSELSEFEECFFTGTATEITPINSISYQGKMHTFQSSQQDSFTQKVVSIYNDIVHGKYPKYSQRLS